LEGNLDDSSELGELLRGIVLDISDSLKIAWRRRGREEGGTGRGREVNVWREPREEGDDRREEEGGDDDETNR